MSQNDEVKVEDVKGKTREAFSPEELKKYLNPDGQAAESKGETVLEGVDGGGQAVLDDEAWEPADVLHEPPHLVVSQPKGSFCQLDSRFSLALPPDDVYNIITDPNNRRVFKNIKEVTYRKVLEDDGNQQKVEVEQVARWRFLVFSGSFASRVIVVQNRKNHTMEFQLSKPGGPMKKFKGSWLIEPLHASEAHWISTSHVSGSSTIPDGTASDKERKQEPPEGKAAPGGKGAEGDPVVGSWVTLHQVVEPALIPPWPFAGMVRNVSAKLIREILGDMQREAHRIATLRKTDSKADPLPPLPPTSEAKGKKAPSEPIETGPLKNPEVDEGAGLLSLQGLSLGYGQPPTTSNMYNENNEQAHV